MSKYTRQQEIVFDIADYLTDGEDDEYSVMLINESIKAIESYGISFNSPCDQLVTNAIRHLEYIINPWNKNDIPVILMEISGMTMDEINKYWVRSTPMKIVFE